MISGDEHIMKFLIVQLPPLSRHLIPLRSKYSSQNPVLKHPQSMLFPSPNTIVKNKKDRTCLFIDAAILSDRNVKQKETEKKLKYKNLSIEIQRMWNMKYSSYQ
jgi:hypothetical protein